METPVIRKRKKVKPLPIVIIAVILLVIGTVLYLFTPFGFWSVPLEGEYQVKITVNNTELTATMENSTSAQAFRQMLRRGSPGRYKLRSRCHQFRHRRTCPDWTATANSRISY